MPLLPSSYLLLASTLPLLYLSHGLINHPKPLLANPTLSLLGSSMSVRPASFLPDLSSSQSEPLSSAARKARSLLTSSERELLALLGLLFVFVALSQAVFACGLIYTKAGLVSSSGTSTSIGTNTGAGKAQSKTGRKDSARLAMECYALLATQSLWQVLCGVHVFLAGGIVAWIYLFHSGVAADGSGGLVGGMLGSARLGMELLANDVVFTFGMFDMLFYGYVYTVIREERREVLLLLQRRREEDEEERVNKGL